MSEDQVEVLIHKITSSIEKEYVLIRRSSIKVIAIAVGVAFIIVGVGGWSGAVSVARDVAQKELSAKTLDEWRSRIATTLADADKALQRTADAEKKTQETLTQAKTYDDKVTRAAEISKSVAWLIRYDWSRGVFDTNNPEVKAYHETTYQRAEQLYNELTAK